MFGITERLLRFYLQKSVGNLLKVIDSRRNFYFATNISVKELLKILAKFKWITTVVVYDL
jgi:hypothetical protein